MGSSFRHHFPIFANNFDQNGIVYFDSAATTLKSTQTIKKAIDFYTHETSSVSRGTNALAEKNTLLFEETRQKFADFINASPEEIVFTSNCTDAINLVASSLDYSIRNEIVVSILEHHSNYLPWKYRGRVHTIGLDASGKINLEELAKTVSERTKVIATTYVSNVTGNIQPVQEIVEMGRHYEALTLIDAAQAVSHIPIDVKQIDCDFMTFSAHKMFGPSGVGMLYGKKEALQLLKPKNMGGGMVNKIEQDAVSFKSCPHLFEAGTPNIEGVLGLGGALDFFAQHPLYNLRKTLHSLDSYLKAQIRELPFIHLPFAISDDHIPIVTFCPQSGINVEHLATMLSDCHNIYVRSGYHCAQPLSASHNIAGSLRVSLHIYNTTEEIDKFISVLKDLKPILQ